MSVHFETERLILRSVNKADTKAFLERLFSDPDVMEYDPGGRLTTLDEAAARIQRWMDRETKYGMSWWAMILKETGEIIGNCGLIPAEGHGSEVEIGYDIAKAFWRQGFASEAATATLKYGFEVLGLERVIALCDEPNVGSWKVMEKVGMRRVGFTREYYDVEALLYDITADQFAKHQADTHESA